MSRNTSRGHIGLDASPFEGGSRLSQRQGQAEGDLRRIGARQVEGDPHAIAEKSEDDVLDEAVRLDPGYACAYNNNRGRVHSFKRDYDRAIADYDLAIKLDPSLALAYSNRGESRLYLVPS